jgi:hypothetical protein
LWADIQRELFSGCLVLKTVAVLLGVLLIVAGIVTALVTGLDPLYGSIGLALAGLGFFIALKWRPTGEDPRGDGTITSGRSVQRPLEGNPSRGDSRMRNKL